MNATGLRCAKRHVNVLGFKDAALFAFSSCLPPDEYVNEPFYKSPLLPGIRNDLDFLVMRLFCADSGYGRIFKDIQVQDVPTCSFYDEAWFYMTYI